MYIMSKFHCYSRSTHNFQDWRSKNESGGAEPYIPHIPLMIEKKSLFSKKVGGLSFHLTLTKLKQHTHEQRYF